MFVRVFLLLLLVIIRYLFTIEIEIEASAPASAECVHYDSLFLDYLHKSLELECSTKDLQKSKVCRAILKKLKYYNKQRSKHCYGEEDK